MALGMIEVFGFTTSIVVADAMAKAADVKIVAIDKNKPAAGDSAKVPLVMAIKAEGSAAAVEASDLVLIADDLRALPKAIKIARKTRAIVMQNIVFSLIMKLGFMALGAFGVLPLWLAVFADVGVMLLAVCNSFRVRCIK